MKKYKWFWILLTILFLIQIFRIDKTNQPINSSLDYVSITKAPENIRNLLKNSCYDCHSNQIKYPWYSNIAPVSWFIKSHIDEGREHLNFSEFGNYNKYQINGVLSDCVTTMKKGEMPLGSYTIIHKKSILNKKEQEQLLAWFVEVQKKYSKKNIPND